MHLSPQRPSLSLAGLAAVCILLAAGCGRQADFPTADGQSFRFAEQRGKWVVINYWAPWCAPCREEIPELNRLAAEYAETISVVGVHLDGKQGQALHKDIAEMGIDFTVLASDPGPVLGWTWPQVVPMTRLLDSKGRRNRSLAGPQTVQTILAAMNKHSGN